jgi:hypothetical protein
MYLNMAKDASALYSLSLSDKRTKLQFNGAKLVTIASTVLLFLLLANVLGSCLFSISCGRYLPTVSFVGSLVTHDKLLVSTCTICFVIGQVLVLAVLTELRRKYSLFETAFVYLTMTLFSGLLLCATLVDEVNGLVIKILNDFHIFFSFSALVVGLSWLYFVMGSLSDSARIKNSPWMRTSQRLLIGLVLMAAATLLEWQLANSIYWNWFLNETVEALCEWTLLALAIAVPAVLVQALPEFEVSLSLLSV